MTFPPPFDPAEPDGALLADYLDGRASPTSRAAVEQWLAERQDAAVELAILRAAWETQRAPYVAGDLERFVTRMRAQVDSPARMSRVGSWKGGVSRRLGRGRGRGWKVGMVVGGGGLGLVIALRFGLSHSASAPESIYTTHAAERLTVTLGDGNRATLAPQTTLTVYGATMTLSGEALFTVTHRGDTPFSVRTGSVTTRVLGTVFDVRRYAGDRETRVAVLEGRVETRAGMRTMTLVAGSVGRVADSAGSVTLTRDVTTATSWTHGRLVFDKATVADVLTAAGHWYGYTFRLARRDSVELMRQHVTVSLDTRSVADAVSQLGDVLNATATIDSATSGTPVITLRAMRAPHPVAPSRQKTSETLFNIQQEVGR